MTREPSSGKDDRGLSDEALRQEESIKETVASLLDVDAFRAAGSSADDLSPEAKGMAYGSVVNDLLADDQTVAYDAREPRARARWWTVLLLVVAAVVIGGAFLAAAMLVINSRSPDTAGSSGSGAATGASVTDPAAAPVTGDCTIPDGTITVDTRITETTSDDHRTNVRGETVITNNGTAPVYVAWRESQSTGHDNSGNELTDEGWYGGPYLMQPGEARTELVGAQVFTSGESTWTVITDIAVFAESPECANPVFEDGEPALEAIAEPVANPFPAGP